MRPVFRIVPATLAAFVVALTVATATSARHHPPRPQKGARPVTSAVPYIAPWQTGFEKFATQTFASNTDGAIGWTMTIPAGQWWRIVFISGQYTTSAVAGTRQVKFEVTTVGAPFIYIVPAIVSQGPSTTINYLYGPNLTAYSNVSVAGTGVSVCALPDVLLPPRATLIINPTTSQAGDAWLRAAYYAVEIYTEERPGVFAPALPPTPLIP